MQFFKVADGGNPDGTAKDGVIGVSAGTKYKSAVWNDNFFNILDHVVGQGYSLIDDDLEQFTKALKGKYQPAFTYNTSAPATQTVADIVEGSDGLFYECQTDALTGEDPVGSVTGNWKVKRFNHIDIVNKTLSYAMTDAATDILTNVQNQRKYLKLTGTLTADRILQVDVSIEHELVIENATVGGFSVTVQGATGTGKIIPTGETLFLYCNGTNVESGQETGLLSTNNFMHIQDQKTSGTSGGTSVSTTNNIRDLNTIISNTIDGASLSANQFTLPAGTYLIKATSSCFKSVLTREKIYNVTDVIYAAVGVNVYMNATYVTGTPVSVESGPITISSPKTFEVRTYTSNGSVDGLGTAISDGTEIYTDLQIYQLKKG